MSALPVARNNEADRYQIIKNESKPGHELCAEKDLSTFGRFTRGRYVFYIKMNKEEGLTDTVWENSCPYSRRP